MDIPIAANVLGTLGAVCWSVQLIPQIIINYRRHDTTGLQPTMMLLWASAGIPLGVYNIGQSFNLALQIQPQILTFLSLTTWVQCMYYGVDTKWPWRKCIFAVLTLGIAMGGVEVGLIFGLRTALDLGISWPSKLMAVLSAVLLSAGVLRHYWDIYKERTVRGISFVFVGIDALGDVTSLISVLFQPELDILGMVIYGSELILWLGVFACGGWFNLRPKVISQISNRRAKRRRDQEVNDQGEVQPEVDADRFPYSVDQLEASSSTVFRTASNVSSHDELRLRNLTLANDAPMDYAQTARD